ncbi:MAG TPA: hypothetical protein VG146_17485 [Verrucomicrobiae bacterium]|nr:hypothetical protein [Verrucomicrobiae bacterium]
MLHFRIIGVIWLILSLAGAAVFAPQLWLMAADHKYGLGSGFNGAGFWVSQFLAEGFLIAGAVLGFGLIRLRRWAALCTRVAAVLLLLYCLAFVTMAGFAMAFELAGLFGLLFAGYSLFVVWRFTPCGRTA